MFIDTTTLVAILSVMSFVVLTTLLVCLCCPPQSGVSESGKDTENADRENGSASNCAGCVWFGCSDSEAGDPESFGDVSPGDFSADYGSPVFQSPSPASNSQAKPKKKKVMRRESGKFWRTEDPFDSVARHERRLLDLRSLTPVLSRLGVESDLAVDLRLPRRYRDALASGSSSRTASGLPSSAASLNQSPNASVSMETIEIEQEASEIHVIAEQAVEKPVNSKPTNPVGQMKRCSRCYQIHILQVDAQQSTA